MLELNDKNMSDEFNTDILESLSKKKNAEGRQEAEDGLFNSNNYVSNEENNDLQMYEGVKEWMPSVVMSKIRDIVSQHLL